LESTKDSKDFGKGGVSAWVTLTVCSLLFMLNYMDRQVLSVVLEPMRKDLGLSDTQAGMLQSIFLLCIALFAFPVGALVDRWSRKKSIGLMALIWSVATFMTGLGKNFVGVILPRTFVGVGEAGFSSGGTAMITAAFPASFRSRAMGIFNAFMALGIALGVVLGGYLSANFGGWRTPFYFFAIPGVILGIIAFFLKDYKTVEEGSSAGKGFWQNAAYVFKVPSMRWIFVGAGLTNFSNYAMLAWFPTLLIRTMKVGEDKAGLIMGIIVVGSIIGTFLGGYLADLWYRRNIKGRVLVASWAALAALGFVVAGIFLLGIGQYMVAFIMLFIYAVISATWLPGINVASQEVVHPRNKAMAWGMAVLFMYLIGAPSPAIVGAISDLIGGGVAGLQYAMLIPPFVGVFASLCFWRCSVNYPRDVDKIKNLVLEAE